MVLFYYIEAERYTIFHNCKLWEKERGGNSRKIRIEKVGGEW